MRFLFPISLVILPWSLATPAWSQAVSQPTASGSPSTSAVPVTRVPSGVILVQGAWSSASDSVTPVPEGAQVANGVFSDPYFGATYALPRDWIERYKGPPPSDSGRYVLAQLIPADSVKEGSQGTILITAQDLFFTPPPATNARELVEYMKDNLQSDYTVEVLPKETDISGRPFTVFAYWSPVAQLHWYVLATEIRCHVFEIVLTGRDTKLLNRLMLDLNKMELPGAATPMAKSGAGDVPVCINGYAREENIITRINPILTEHKYNPVPVRIVIDREGLVKHIHFLSAFPDQAKAITDALNQWKFKPYRRDGQPMEVETGILFGRARASADGAKQ
jgi:hypothetical protein